jgi:dimeric dUTPase (all-alpha-NTP-PPase superfamily)
MEKLSHLFNEKIMAKKPLKNPDEYRQMLLYLLMSQTSCFRYWGQGMWTDYGKEIIRRAVALL